MSKRPELQSNEEWIAGYTGASQPDVPPYLQVQTKQHESSGALSPPLENRQGKSNSKLVMPEDLAALIPEGSYVARCISHRICEYWGDPKLIFTFQITRGEYSGTNLDCFYNLKKQKNDVGYIPGPRGHYMRMLRSNFGDIKQKNESVIQPQFLVGKVFNVEVVTVHSDHKRNSLDGANKYSKIETNINLRDEKNST